MSESVDKVSDRFRNEVDDALMLLEFAISSGYITEDGRKVDDQIIEDIKQAEDLIRKNEFPSSEYRTKFSKAYRDLAILLSPVTVETLRATSLDYGRKSLLNFVKPIPEAKIWSRKLTLWTLLFVVVAVAGESFKELQSQFAPPMDEVSGGWRMFPYMLKMQLEILAPFTYGGMGACAMLLRACHKFIHTRQFDMARIPEYYSRILLGVVSGGAIVLFVSEIASDNGTIKLSAAALGFLAGYNTDFLFSTIERISQAILPKLDVESVKRASPQLAPATVSIEGSSLKDLIDNYNSAKDDAGRELYRSLIERVRDRI